MRILIVPAAGNGERFRKAGYVVPKPFIRLAPTGLTMLFSAAATFVGLVDAVHTITRPDHEASYGEYTKDVRELLKTSPPGPPITTRFTGHVIEHLQEGAALTILSTIGHVPDDAEIIIANSDQLFSRIDLESWIGHIEKFKPAGSILTFHVPDKEDKRWSFVKVFHNDRRSPRYVTQVVEKRHVSDEATCGAYYFKTWRDLRNAIARMINVDARVNNEFYLAPAYNFLGGPISAYQINGFQSLGTPELLQAWEDSISRAEETARLHTGT
jgi:dTDP-glucose pyrophosphorylase